MVSSLTLAGSHLPDLNTLTNILQIFFLIKRPAPSFQMAPCFTTL